MPSLRARRAARVAVVEVSAGVASSDIFIPLPSPLSRSSSSTAWANSLAAGSWERAWVGSIEPTGEDS